jgi:hypothetical protein
MKKPRPLSAQGRIRAFVKSNPNATMEEICAAVDVTSKDVSNYRYKLKHSPTQAPEIVPIVHNDSMTLRRELNNLKHQIVGYQAVISYLENQLGMKSTSHGSPV